MDLCTVDKKLEDLARKYGLRLRTRRDYDRWILHYTFISDSSLVSFNRSINIMEATQSDFDEIENSLRLLQDKKVQSHRMFFDKIHEICSNYNLRYEAVKSTLVPSPYQYRSTNPGEYHIVFRDRTNSIVMESDYMDISRCDFDDFRKLEENLRNAINNRMGIRDIDKKLEDLAFKYGFKLRKHVDYIKELYYCTFRWDDTSNSVVNRTLMLSHVNQSDFDEIENSLRKLADKITNHMKLIVNSVYGAGMDGNRTIWKWDPDRLCSVIDKSTSRDNELVEFKPQWMRTFGEKGVNRGAADELKRITKKFGYGGDFDGDTVSKVTITGGLTMHTNFEIKNVIFNDPATIVFWADGSKTIVKAENDEYDPEKGLAMAIAKKALGNKGNYYNKIKKWLHDEKAVNDADGEN